MLEKSHNIILGEINIIITIICERTVLEKNAFSYFTNVNSFGPFT